MSVTEDEVREEVEERSDDFDEDEWSEKVDQNHERFKKFVDDRDFAAWATAHLEYGVKVDSDYSLPMSSGDGGGGGPPEDAGEVTISDVLQGGVGDDEQFTIEGYITRIEEATTDNGNPQRKITLADKEETIPGGASGDDPVSNFEGAGINKGDYVRIEGAQVYSPDPEFFYLSLGKFVDYEVVDDPPYDEDETAGGEYLEDLTVQDIQQGIAGNEDSFDLEGYVLEVRSSVSDAGNDQRKFTIRDKTGELRGGASGDDAVETWDEAGIEPGDYVEIENAGVFNPDDDFFYLSFGGYTDYNVVDEDDVPYTLDDLAEEYEVGKTSEDAFVVFKGMVSDHDKNNYDGCPKCYKGWDPEDLSACPKCGHDENVDHTFHRVYVSDGDVQMTVEISPNQDPGADSLIMSGMKVYGNFEIDEYETDDGETIETKKIDAQVFEVEQMDIDDAIPEPESPDTSDDDESEEEEVEETEETEDDSDDEDESADVSDSDLDDETREMVETVEEHVEDFGSTMWASTPAKILEQNYQADDDTIRKVFTHVEERGVVQISNGDVDDDDWADIEVKPTA